MCTGEYFQPTSLSAERIIQIAFIGLMLMWAKPVTDYPSEYSPVLCNIHVSWTYITVAWPRCEKAHWLHHNTQAVLFISTWTCMKHTQSNQSVLYEGGNTHSHLHWAARHQKMCPLSTFESQLSVKTLFPASGSCFQWAPINPPHTFPAPAPHA